MQRSLLVGIPFMMCGGYVAVKWMLAGSLNAERLVAVGGMYHWTALTLLTVGMAMWFLRERRNTGSFWGDFKQLSQPLVLYAVLASGTVWTWNHVIDAESTALRKALRIAQIEDHTANDDAYQEFVASQAQTSETPNLPGRTAYREQAMAQVNWMLSGGVTFVLSLLTYLFAAVMLALLATALLHHIWGLSTLS